MICLIPVSRFRVRHEVATGRPYSQVEVMILRAIRSGLHDIGSMRATFQMHPRILIEGLVTLTQAGWIATSQSDDGGFVLTAEGADATDGNRTPATTLVTPRTEMILLERVTGGLIGNHEVRFSTRSQLKAVWEDALRLAAEVDEAELDEGQLRQLLRRSKGEWVRWVGPIELIGKNAHWVVVGVDTDSGSVTGLPERWERRLGPVIVEQAQRRERSLSPAARARVWAPVDQRLRRDAPNVFEGPKAWPIQLGNDDILFDGEAHTQRLRLVLREAQSSVFIASAFLGRQALAHLREPLIEALRRGVDIDLLWGYGDGGASVGAPLDELKRLAYDAGQQAGAGDLRFNREPSGSHAKLVLCDGLSGVTAIVGSFNWLSAFAHDTNVNVSIVIRESGLVADAAACAAALWSATPSEALSSAPDRWRNIAAELERSANQMDEAPQDEAAQGVTARVMFDREHDVLFREWLATSQSRFLAFSHRLGPAAEVRLAAARLVPGRQCVACYSLTELDETWRDRIAGTLQALGGTLLNVPETHAKVLVSDASVCISSYNFLSADPFGTAKRARELGVVLEGASVAAFVAERMVRLLGR